jgi:uncharacterized membrane protein
MPIKSRENLISAWAFLMGILLAILVGFFGGTNVNPILLLILAGLGILVGFFVAEKNVQSFLLASVSLVIVSFAGIQGLVSGSSINTINTVVGVNFGRSAIAILSALLVFFIPSTIVVAIKTVFSFAKS